MAEKPSVLIIGGLGYIGRFLALHIHQNELASEVRLVDKVLPQLAWLAPEFDAACSAGKFVQADASRERESLPSPSSHFRPESGIRRKQTTTTEKKNGKEVVKDEGIGGGKRGRWTATFLF